MRPLLSLSSTLTLVPDPPYAYIAAFSSYLSFGLDECCSETPLSEHVPLCALEQNTTHLLYPSSTTSTRAKIRVQNEQRYISSKVLPMSPGPINQFGSLQCIVPFQHSYTPVIVIRHSSRIYLGPYLNKVLILPSDNLS